MTAKHRNLRLKMLLTTASAALLAVPGAASAQLVSSGDLVTAQDSAGNTGQITISNPDAATANISVLAPVVIANWTQFNVPVNTTLNVSNASAATQASLLNRVIGGNFSDIGGTINALGVNLWLINQNGILFGDKTSVNASSFFASTLGVADADFFDFYEGTDIAGSGTSTVRFSGPAASTTALVAPAGAKFMTDGTLFFGSAALNLTADFNAQSGGVGFVAASDFSVSFNAGSPVSYTISSGTTVANQRVGGSVAGKDASFVMISSAGVVNALLQVDANVTTTATPTSTGIFLAALSVGAPSPNAQVNGTLSSTGVVSTNISGNLTANAPIAGSQVFLQPGGALIASSVTATAGGITLGGASINAGALTATGNIAANSAGAVTLASARADSDSAGGGSLLIGNSITPTSVTITGAAQGAVVDIQASGNLQLANVTSTNGVVDLDSTGGAISAGAVSATGGDATLTAPGAITITSIGSSGAVDVDSTGGGTLSLGNLNAGTTVALDTTGAIGAGSVTAGGAFTIGATLDPASITLSGNVVAASVDLESNGALNAMAITANAGDIDIDTAAAAITAGALTATDDVSLNAQAPISLASARADSDLSGAGNLAIGAITAPTSLTITGAAQGASVDLQASGNLQLGSVTSTNGVVDLDSTGGAIAAGAVSATGGGALLTAPSAITTTSISSTAAIDVDSTAGGSLSLGNLNAITSIALDTSGAVAFGSATAGTAFTIGASIAPASVAATGNVIAGLVDFDITGALTALGVTATAGDVDIDAGSFAAGALIATDDVSVDAAGTVSLASARADSDASGAGNLAIGAVTLPSSLTIAGVAQGVAVDLQAAGSLQLSDVVSTGGLIDLDSTGGGISAGDVSATGGDALLTAPGAITTSSITSSLAIDVISTGGGALDLGNLDAAGNISLDTTGSLEAGSIEAGGFLSIGSLSTPSSVLFTGDATANSMIINSLAAITTEDLTSNQSLVVQTTNADLTTGVVTVRNAGAALVLAAVGAASDVTSAGLVTNGGNITVTAGQDISTGAIATALTGTPTAGNVMLDAGRNATTGFAFAGGDMSIAAAGDVTVDGAAISGALTVGAVAPVASATFTGDVSAASIDIDAVGAIIAQDGMTLRNITATAGAVDLDSTGGAILAGAVSATGGDALLTAAGAIATTSIASAAAIDVDSTGGGALSVGSLSAGTTIALDTSGTLAFGSATAGGGFTAGLAVGPSSISATGDVAAASAQLRSAGSLTVQAVTATAGQVNLRGIAIAAGDLMARDDIVVNSPGAVSIASAKADSDSDAHGSLTVGNITNPATLAISGLAQGASLNLRAFGDIQLGTAVSTAGLAQIRSTTGAIAADTISAVGGPALLSAAGDVAANSITSTGVIDVESTGGAISAGAVSATGGSALLTAAGNVTTTSIVSTGAIDVDSTGGGALAVGNLNAGTTIALDTSGSVSADSATAGGALAVGTAATPGSVNFAGNIVAASVDLRSNNLLTAQDIAATGGTIALRGETIDAAVLAGPQDITFQTVTNGGTATFDSIVSTGGLVGVNGVVPGAITINGLTQGARVAMVARNVLDLGAVNSTAGNVLLQASVGVLTAGAVSATGGSATLVARDGITTGAIASTGAIDVDSLAGGALDLGPLTAGTGISLDTSGTVVAGAATAGGAFTIGGTVDPSGVTLNGNISAASVDFDVVGALNAQAITAIAGDIDIDAGSVSATALTATDDVFVDASGAISLASVRADSDSSGGGSVAIGATTLPSSLTVAGVTRGFAVDLQAAGNLQLGNVVATHTTVDLDSTGGSISTGSVSAVVQALLTAPGAITTGSIAGAQIDVDSTGGGALTLGNLTSGTTITLDTSGAVGFGSAMASGGFSIGGTVVPSSISATGNVVASGIQFDTTGLLSAGDISSTSNIIRLFAGAIDAGDVSAAGNLTFAVANSGDATFDSLVSTGGVVAVTASAPRNLTVRGETRGTIVSLDAVIDINLANVTSTVSGTGLFSTGGSISADAINSAGVVLIEAPGNISTASITADIFIDVDSTAGGAVSLGNLNAGTTIDLDTSGTLTAGSAIAGGALTVGGAVLPSSVTFSGNINASTVSIDAVGALTAQNITATAGVIDIDAGAVTAGALAATGAVLVDAGGAIALTSALADSDNAGGEGVAIGAAVLPSSLAITGETRGGSVDLQASGNIALGDVVSTAGVIDIDSTAGSISVDDVTGQGAGGDVLITATQNVTATGSVASTLGRVDIDAVGGAITVTGITAGGGNAELTALTSITATQTIAGRNVDIDAGGALTAASISATAGDIDIDAGSATTGALTATDDVFVDGGAAMLIASARADSDANGAGNLVVGASTLPSSLTITGAAQGVAVDLQASGNLTLGSVASTAGVIDVDSTAGSIATGAVTAQGGGALLTAAQGVAASGAITSSANVDIDAVNGAISLTSVTASGGNAELTARNAISASGAITGRIVDIDAGGALTAQAITATAGDIDIDAGSIDASALAATDDVFVDAAGAVSLTSARADSDASGAGNLQIGVTMLPSSLAISGSARGKQVDLRASGNVTLGTATSDNGFVNLSSAAGSIATGAVSATGGDAVLRGGQNVVATGTLASSGKVDIDAIAGSISTVTVTASGGNAELTAAGNVTTAGTVTGRTVDIDSTAGSISTAAVTATAGDALVTAAQNVTSTGTVSASAKVDIDALNGAISTAAVTATAGNAELTARGAVTTTGTVRAGGAIDVDSTAGGALTLGAALTTAATPALSAGGAIALDTTGAVSAGATAAGGVLTIGSTAQPSEITLTGPAAAASMMARTQGLFTTQGAINAGSAATITARDMAIGAALAANDVTLRAGATGTVALGTGPGTLSLSDAELDRITANNLAIDAGASPVTVADVSFTGGAGSGRVDVATTGTISFGGDLSGDGATRTFRFGGAAGTGDATATGLATRITGDIESATINLGQATLDLRATDVVFGRSAFVSQVAGRTSGDIAATLVGNAASALYNSELDGPLAGDRTADRIYLRTGSLRVSYANSALFQNTGSITSGGDTSSGVALGGSSGGGLLTLDTTDPTNAFALFGTINNLVGSAVALAGPSVIVVDGTLQPPNSRINGCIIGSGAGCLNTTIGAVRPQLPRENVNLLSADSNLLVPFDPLVGTNNEGLFSDAASDDSLECPRDENGVCVDQQGAR